MERINEIDAVCEGGWWGFGVSVGIAHRDFASICCKLSIE